MVVARYCSAIGISRKQIHPNSPTFHQSQPADCGDVKKLSFPDYGVLLLSNVPVNLILLINLPQVEKQATLLTLL